MEKAADEHCTYTVRMVQWIKEQKYKLFKF